MELLSTLVGLVLLGAVGYYAWKLVLKDKFEDWKDGV